jgi:hypothetical protein
MTPIWIVFLAVALQALTPGPPDADARLRNGRTWEQFLQGVSAQRELWLKTTSAASAPIEFIERATAASRGLRLVVVTEDWCPDSAYTVPYVASLARASSIPLRILNRVTGEPLLLAHRTPDGRTATPTIVLWRDGRDVGAWVERPAALQRMFLSMSTNAESAQRFSQRHTWYESDRGRTALTEVLALIEQTREKK